MKWEFSLIDPTNPRNGLRGGVRTAVGLSAVALGLLIPTSALLADSASPNVLILNSYHLGFDWTDDEVEGTMEVFAERMPAATVYVEYLDTKRHLPEEVFSSMYRLLGDKYEPNAFDLLLATDDNALKFLEQYGRKLFGQIPIVFCGINDPALARSPSLAPATGIVEKLDVVKTLTLARDLQPQLQRVFVVSDDTPTGRAQEQVVREASSQLPDLTFEYLDGNSLTTDQLSRRIRGLEDGDVVLLTVWLRDATGRYVDYPRRFPELFGGAPVPVYGLVDLWLGYGIMGGKLNSGRWHGRRAAEMAVTILQGTTSPEEIPIEGASVNPYMFDYRQLERFGIDPGDLPPDSQVVHQPVSLMEVYWDTILAAAGVILLLVVAILILAGSIVKRRQAQQAMQRSERNYRILVDSATDLVCRCDADARLEFASPSMIRLAASGRSDLPARLTSMVHPDDRQEFLQATREAARPPYSARVECRIADDGDWRTIQWALTGLTGPRSEVEGFTAVGRDVTEARRSERELRLAHERLSFHLLNTPLGFIEWDSEFRVTHWSPRAEKIFGWSKQEVRGRKLGDWRFVHEDDAKEVTERAGELMRGGRVHMQNRNYTRSGDVVHCEWFNSALLDDDGNLVSILSLVLDVTERVEAQRDREQLESQIQHAQKLESLGVLAGGIAHDFNNLLVGILGNADLALEDLSEVAPARTTVSEIRRAALRASELTNQMLAYSGKGRFVIQPVDLNEVMSEMSHLLRASISKNATLRLAPAKDLPPVEVDIAQIQQVVMNLLTNASDALQDESGVITLASGVIDADDDYLATTYLDEDLTPGRYVYLEVCDTGCGMDEETRTRVFDPFFTTKFAGRGLGLAAVLGIVRGHRGAIKVYSEPGSGTTIRVLLPASEESEPVAVGEDPADDQHEPVDGGTVLVADDERTVRDVAAAMLERSGFEVIKAGDGAEAVDLYRQSPDRIDAVLLDMTMPNMNGERAFTELRRLDPDVRVVLASGYNEQDATNRFAGKGLAGFIQKPFQYKELVRRIRTAIRN